MHRRVMLSSLALLAACALSLPAQAQVHRHFPANALRGEFEMQAFPNVQINHRAARMAPGGRIWGDTGLLQQPGALIGGRYIVNYRVEASSGLVIEVWILNPVELANKRWPHTSQEAATWQFDAASQTWTKP
ncbi:MAG TPA: hypothetical protein VGM81_11865 [Burkholderiaceae bacterium]